MPFIPPPAAPTARSVPLSVPLPPAITPRAQPSPKDGQVVVDLSTLVTIPNFSRFYPGTSPDSFQPIYCASVDGSLVAPPLLHDLGLNNIFLIIIGCLLSISLRNLCNAALYLWRGKIKKKDLLYSLFLSQLLGPFAIIPIIIAQFSRSVNCAVILRITSISSGISLSLLLTGILGVKAYRCLDNNRFVSGSLVALRTAGSVVLILDVITLQSFRSLSGRCYRPSAGFSSVFMMFLLTESFFICACFLYAVWKPHGPVAVRGRISVQLSLNDLTSVQPTEPRKETPDSVRNRKGWSDVGPPTNHLLTSPQIRQPSSLSREPSITSIRHNVSQRTHSHDTPGNAASIQNPKHPIPFPSRVHSHTPAPRPWTARMPTTTDEPHLSQRVATFFKRPTRPHPSLGRFTRYIPRMSLFREVVRDELCYTAVITAFTTVSAAMTLVGVKSAGGINTTIWVTFDWALISLLVVHSFGRVIRRHENELLLHHPSAWYHDLHTDCTTAELLQDVPQPVRTPGILSRARAHPFVAHHSIDGSASPSDLFMRRLFPESACSLRGDLQSSAASTGGMSNMFLPMETESFSRAHSGRPHVAGGRRVPSTMSTEDLSLGPSRSRKFADEWFNKNLLGAPSPPEPPDGGCSFGGSACWLSSHDISGMEPENDELVSVLPVHYSDRLGPNVHIHQFPLLNRPLQAPPSATISGKRVRARVKPVSHRIEIHVPVDARPEVWNHEKGKDLGGALHEDDREKNQEDQVQQRGGEGPRLTDSRLQSDAIPHCGAYMLGVVRDGRLHLVPISETHQFRPTLTYLDVMSRKARHSRGRGSDTESDDGPPPDPDEILPVVTAAKKEKKAAEAKEVQVSARKSGDDKSFQGGMSVARREMLLAIRAEEDEPWQPVQFCDVETADSVEVFESIFSQDRDEGPLECKTEMTSYLKSIKGL